MKNRIVKTYNKLNKTRKKILIKSLIFAMFLLGINTYAWFIFFDKFDGNIKADVIGWDVSFYDEDTLMDAFALEVGSLYPGMDDFIKVVRVSNSSDVAATFSYELVSFSLFGESYEVNEIDTSDKLLGDLESSFPFKIVFVKSKSELYTGGDTATFTITVSWDYESINPYYQLDNYFEYDASFIYYTYNGSSYVVDNSVTNLNIDSKISSGLFIESDDADSYWGEKAATYLTDNPDSSCLTLELNLIVAQVNS